MAHELDRVPGLVGRSQAPESIGSQLAAARVYRCQSNHAAFKKSRAWGAGQETEMRHV